MFLDCWRFLFHFFLIFIYVLLSIHPTILPPLLFYLHFPSLYSVNLFFYSFLPPFIFLPFVSFYMLPLGPHFFFLCFQTFHSLFSLTFYPYTFFLSTSLLPLLLIWRFTSIFFLCWSHFIIIYFPLSLLSFHHIFIHWNLVFSFILDSFTTLNSPSLIISTSLNLLDLKHNDESRLKFILKIIMTNY